jgi:hypothetical protein
MYCVRISKGSDVLLRDISFPTDVKKWGHACLDGSFAETRRLYSGWGCGRGDVVFMQSVSWPTLPNLNYVIRMLLYRLQRPDLRRLNRILCTLIPSTVVGLHLYIWKNMTEVWMRTRLHYMSISYNMTFFFPLWLYSPIQALAASMKISVSLQLLEPGESVGLLGQVISSSQGLYLYTNTEKPHTAQAINIHAQSEIEPTVPASTRTKTVHALDRSATETGLT